MASLSPIGWIRSKVLDNRSVSLARIVHNDLLVYMDSGYGARPIPEWPFYQFIQIYLGGSEQESIVKWTQWLAEQFMTYGMKPKSRGGMYQGSVHRNAAQVSLVDTERALSSPNLLSERDVEIGAEFLIRKRLEMVSSIARRGYCPDMGDPVFAIDRSDSFVLKGGHHRAATLLALGYEEMPEIYMLSSNGWRLRQWWTTARKTLNLQPK